MAGFRKKTIAMTMGICSFFATFSIVSILTLVALSDAKFSDFFTTGRVSHLKNRAANISKDVVVDVSSIQYDGGIKTLTENLIGAMAQKRPHWRFILLTSDNFHDNFSKLKKYDNVKFLYARAKYNKVFLSLRNAVNFLTLGLFRDKITQLTCYNTICLDDKCDLFFDPYAEIAVNDFSIPKVSLIHDLAYLDLPQYWLPDMIEWRKIVSNLIIQSSKKIITISEFSKQKIINSYRVNKDQIAVIATRLARRISHSNLNADFANSILKKYGLDKRNYFIYPSSLWNHKNHLRLWTSFAKFSSSSGLNLKLAIVGKFQAKDSSDYFKNILKKKGLLDKVILTNFVPDNELKVLLANALALVFPSLYEGFGMPVIEAMTEGVPVICSNAGSLPEVAGDAALFFNPTNVEEMTAAMSKIAADADLRNKLIQRGYKQAEKFANTDVMVDEYLKIFESIMKN
ncbi:MAG: glycosyltransferase family 4 protein [Holosporaceae bacterium]|jgi:glycosyltransferase involved in cell wall biosynthesis|nr:glycosyltransferase family 4 protein [Holosporaceae bacterium]